MAQTKGVVAKLSGKEWKGRNGTVMLYSFALEGEKGWYRLGTNKPTFAEGDSIEFQYHSDNNGNNTVQDGSVVKMAATPAARAPAVTKSVGTKENWDARAAYWDAKEKREIEVVEPRITLSASRTAAIAVIGLALQHDAIVFGNAAKGARLGIILDAIDEVTSRYYDQSMKGTTAAAEEAPATTTEGEEFND